MAISAGDVKRLREKTGAGLMDCKQALEEAGGDFDKAERILKELGKAAAAKRSGRATNEGRIFVGIKGNRATILELACETDFVARNESFVQLGQTLVNDILERSLTAADAGMEARVQEAISTIKENMSIRRFATLEKGDNEVFSHYIHGESGRLGAIVKVQADNAAALSNQAVADFAFDCALHVVAFRPMFLSESAVDAAYAKEQEEIFMAQAQNLGKPEKVLQGIVQGKLRKHFAEVCLMQQAFVKDDKQSVADVAKAVGKTVGAAVTVTGYLVYAVGEEQ